APTRKLSHIVVSPPFRLPHTANSGARPGRAATAASALDVWVGLHDGLGDRPDAGELRLYPVTAPLDIGNRGDAEIVEQAMIGRVEPVFQVVPCVGDEDSLAAGVRDGDPEHRFPVEASIYEIATAVDREGTR